MGVPGVTTIPPGILLLATATLPDSMPTLRCTPPPLTAAPPPDTMVGDPPTPPALFAKGLADLKVETSDWGCVEAAAAVDDVGVVLPPPRLPDELLWCEESGCCPKWLPIGDAFDWGLMLRVDGFAV